MAAKWFIDAIFFCTFYVWSTYVKDTKLESITRSSLGCISQAFYDINIKGSIVWRAYYFTCIISLNSHDMRVCSHEDILSLLYGWINRIKEKLHNSSEFTGRRSGNNKWIEVSLTPECRWPTVTKQWTQIIRKGHRLRGPLPPSSPLMANPAGEPCHSPVGQAHRGKARFLSKHKSRSDFSGNWCLPRNDLSTRLDLNLLKYFSCQFRLRDTCRQHEGQLLGSSR